MSIESPPGSEETQSESELPGFDAEVNSGGTGRMSNMACTACNAVSGQGIRFDNWGTRVRVFVRRHGIIRAFGGRICVNGVHITYLRGLSHFVWRAVVVKRKCVHGINSSLSLSILDLQCNFTRWPMPQVPNPNHSPKSKQLGSYGNDRL